MRIKNILKFLFSTRFYLIGIKQNPDRAMKKKFLVLKGFNGYDFISQKENWSAFFRVPYYCHGDVPPQTLPRGGRPEAIPQGRRPRQPCWERAWTPYGSPYGEGKTNRTACD